MPRITIDLSSSKDYIQRRVSEGATQEQIVQELQEQGVQTSKATLRRSMAAWKIRCRRPVIEDSEALRNSLTNCVVDLRLTDEETARKLEADGFVIGARMVKNLRKKLGLLKRVTAENIETAVAITTAALEQELQDGHVEDYGRGHLYAYMRSKYHVIGR